MLNLGRRPVLAVFALLPALLATACTTKSVSTPRAPASATIGLLVPTSGANAAAGKEAIQGAQLALSLVNSAYPDLPLPLAPGEGLRYGTKLTLAIGNTESAAEKVEQESSRLVRGGAVGLVLADDISVAAPAGRQTDLLGVALIDALTTSDTFAELNRNSHFRIQPSDREIVSTALALLYRQRGNALFTRVLIASGTSTGELGAEIDSMRGSIDDLSLAAGYTSAGKDHFIPLVGASAGDSSGVHKNDAVLAIVTNPQEAIAANDLAIRLKGIAPVIAFGPGVDAFDALKSPTALRATGWSAEYVNRNPIAHALAAAYEKQFGTKLSEVAASTFTATLAMAVAMDTVTDFAGQSVFTAQAVRIAVQQLSMPATQTIMPWDGIQFDGTGYNQLAAGIVEQHLSNGYLVVHPVELAATPTLNLS